MNHGKIAMDILNETVALAQALIRCRSVAPDDDGAQTLLMDRLQSAGFSVEEIPCRGRRNFWAQIGNQGPLFAFAVHTDVVPEGELSEWTVDPYAGIVQDGYLIGRGAVDMKSQIACVILAVEQFLKECGGPENLAFRLGIFVTGDEEPEGNFGANAILDFLKARGQNIDYCVVTEPTSLEEFGDTVKIGRRGSIHGHVRIHGKQMHSSHPEQMINPIFQALPILKELSEVQWCEGNTYFPRTTFQFTRIHADGGASNTTPAELRFEFNLRFSNELTADKIRERVEDILKVSQLAYDCSWSCNAHPFLTEPGALTGLVKKVVARISGLEPVYSTGGGTSDGRFIAARGTELVEFGFVGRMCHMVDEKAPLTEIDKLRNVYQNILSEFQLRMNSDTKEITRSEYSSGGE